ETAYAIPPDNSNGVHDGLFAAQPDLDAARAGPYAPKVPKYDVAKFEQALPELLAVAPKLRASSAYRYDVMDVARQALSNAGRSLLPEVKAAYTDRDRARFAELSGVWLRWIELLDSVMATDRRTMLGPLLADARAWGDSRDERARLEYDARTILTIWGDREAAETLHDYANREWAGLLGGYYHGRWKAYFDELALALEEQREPKPIDWFAVGDNWARQHNSYPTVPSGDSYLLAGRVLHELRSRPIPTG
ncbi:MAG: alpha-N-acetylglucosaminidase C-terminal domain-containing protein, partial [Pseudonocardiaceae bacterium]